VDVLQAGLPESVVGFSASGDARTGARESSEGRAHVATREYVAKDKSALRIKITDTAEIASLRESLREQLTVMGQGSSGNQTGALIAGHPGVVAYDKPRRLSRAVMLVRGRFLVEAMVRDTDHSAAAREALEKLPVTALPKDEKSSGKNKQP
jgi:hypothetical protein